ncbi:MAG: NAD(P)-dependent oxidoreductase [Dehalococcoidia bacterium]|jgi:nucleoside-diphosphate-sugar epimerase|nr:NAD(P)-dependent oxidoreductase [Dehalococcoidia bacterium]
MPDKRKVLITGGAGLIGSIMIDRLGGKYDFSSLDLRPVEDLPSTIANLDDLEAITPAFEGIDTVVHLAADRSPAGSWKSILQNNFIATYNVFEASKRAGVKRVIFASSNHAEGGFYLDPPWKYVHDGNFELLEQDNYELVTEDHMVRPDSYYGVAKAYGEALGSYYSDFHGLSSFHLRIGWVIDGDDPTFSAYALSLWLSYRDTAQIIDLCIGAPESHRYDIFNATSDNTWKIFSIDHVKEALGYRPEDRAGSDFTLREYRRRD